MNHTMPEEKKSTKPVLVERRKLKRAQRLIKDDSTSWLWKLCMHMAKEAYGLKCDPPIPDVGERCGYFICTYSNKETGEYAFTHERRTSKIEGFEYVAS